LEENQKSTKREAKKKRKESEDAKKQWRLYLLAKGRATYSVYLEYINNPIQLETIVEAAVSYFFLSLYSRFLDCSPAPCRILSRARVSRQLPVENLERSGGHTHTHTILRTPFISNSGGTIRDGVDPKNKEKRKS
jgi:Tfp pilus assembly protein PilV